MPRDQRWWQTVGLGLLGLGLLGLGSCQDVTNSGDAENPAVVMPSDGQGEAGTGRVEVGDGAQAGGDPDSDLTNGSRPVVGDIALYMDELAVRSRLGDPLSITDEETGCCGVLRQLVYPTLTLGLVETANPEVKIVYSLTTASPEVETDAGIRLGSSRQAVIEAYGSPDAEAEAENGGLDIRYVVGDGSSWLWFTLQNDAVAEMGFDSQLN